MKIIKSNIISFILGAILFSGVTVFASTLLSKDITFTPTKEDWQVTTVEEAINDLYDYSREDTINKLDFTTITTESYGERQANRKTTLTVEPGNYIVVGTASTMDMNKTTIDNRTSGGSPKFEYTSGTCTNIKNKGTVGSGNTLYSNHYFNVMVLEGFWKCSFSEKTTLTFTQQHTTDSDILGQVMSGYAIKLN